MRLHLNLVLAMALVGCCKQESSSQPTKTVETTPVATTTTTAPTVTSTATDLPKAKPTAQAAKEVLLMKAETDKSGKLWITDSTGTRFSMVGSAYYRDANVSSDHRMLGAVIGGNAEVSGTTLVLYDNHLSKIREYPSPSIFLCDWEFWNNNTQVALGGCPSHGPWTHSLVDIKTGKQLELFEGIPDDCSKAPKWVKSPACEK